MTPLLALVLALAAASPVPNGLHPEGKDVAPRYTADVRQVFAAAFAPDVALRALVEPSFHLEHVVAVRRTPVGWSLLTLSAREEIWSYESLRQLRDGTVTSSDRAGRDTTQAQAGALAARLRQSPMDIPVTRCERALPAPLAEALVGAWSRQVGAARPDDGKTVVLDGVAYRFAVRTSAGMGAAMAWSPEPELPAGRLAALADELAAFCRNGDDAAAAALEQAAEALARPG